MRNKLTAKMGKKEWLSAGVTGLLLSAILVFVFSSFNFKTDPLNPLPGSASDPVQDPPADAPTKLPSVGKRNVPIGSNSSGFKEEMQPPVGEGILPELMTPTGSSEQLLLADLEESLSNLTSTSEEDFKSFQEGSLLNPSVVLNGGGGLSVGGSGGTAGGSIGDGNRLATEPDLPSFLPPEEEPIRPQEPGGSLFSGPDDPGNSAAVPEPGTILLVGSGLAGLSLFRKRR